MDHMKRHIAYVLVVVAATAAAACNAFADDITADNATFVSSRNRVAAMSGADSGSAWIVPAH